MTPRKQVVKTKIEAGCAGFYIPFAMKNALLLTALLTASACTPTVPHSGSESLDTVDSVELALMDGTPEGIGVLGLLNDPNTTLELLDDDVPLNARAARNLWLSLQIAPFQTIAQVDDVPYVGPAALNRLTAYANAEGWVPEGDDLLGSWDGVEFTANEAEATLALVNASDHATLDIDLGLNRRAATSIVDAQPVPSVAHLANLYYVGRSALTDLRNAAGTPEPPAPFSDQFNHDEALDIPDGTDDGVDSEVHVVGVPDQPVQVTFVLDLVHEALWEVGATLTDPNGDTTQIDITGPVIRQDIWTAGTPTGTGRSTCTTASPASAGSSTAGPSRSAPSERLHPLHAAGHRPGLVAALDRLGRPGAGGGVDDAPVRQHHPQPGGAARGDPHLHPVHRLGGVGGQHFGAPVPVQVPLPGHQGRDGADARARLTLAQLEAEDRRAVPQQEAEGAHEATGDAQVHPAGGVEVVGVGERGFEPDDRPRQRVALPGVQHHRAPPQGAVLHQDLPGAVGGVDGGRLRPIEEGDEGLGQVAQGLQGGVEVAADPGGHGRLQAAQ